MNVFLIYILLKRRRVVQIYLAISTALHKQHVNKFAMRIPVTFHASILCSAGAHTWLHLSLFIKPSRMSSHVYLLEIWLWKFFKKLSEICQNVCLILDSQWLLSFDFMTSYIRINNKNIQDNRTPDYNICTRNKGKTIKNQTNVGSKRDECTKKNSWQKYILRSQQIWESCGIQPIDEWVKGKGREWDEYATRMDVERLVKISSDNIPAGRRCPGRPKRWSD